VVKSQQNNRPAKIADGKENTTQRILECAMRLFVMNGYSGTSVDQIAAAVGMTKGAVYFNFKSKEDMLNKLFDEVEEIIVDGAIKAVAQTPSTAIDMLAAFMNHQASVALSHTQHLLMLILMSIEFFGSNTETEVRVRSAYRRLYSCIENIIHLGQVEGTIRNDIRSYELTSIVMAEHDGVLIEWYRRPGELEGHSLTRAARFLLIDGLRAKS
jgi:AcrR family transcriptional regulator